MTIRMLSFAVLLSTALVLVSGPSIAQEKGKTAAGELTSQSQAALANLTRAPRWRNRCEPKRSPFWYSPRSPRPVSASGVSTGEGTLFKGGKAAAYYKTTGASFGLQAGGQQYGYAMFFMNANALAQLDSAKGFEVGVGPSVVMVDEGMAKTTTTTTLKDDIYALVFGQKGLMAGLGIQGNKITKIQPK